MTSDTSKIYDLTLTCAISDVTSVSGVKFLDDAKLNNIIETNYKYVSYNWHEIKFKIIIEIWIKV